MIVISPLLPLPIYLFLISLVRLFSSSCKNQYLLSSSVWADVWYSLPALLPPSVHLREFIMNINISYHSSSYFVFIFESVLQTMKNIMVEFILALAIHMYLVPALKYLDTYLGTYL